ncbi:MAG: hypothetical protein R3B45_18295 [Bdellovibrionota bacterium]
MRILIRLVFLSLAFAPNLLANSFDLSNCKIKGDWSKENDKTYTIVIPFSEDLFKERGSLNANFADIEKQERLFEQYNIGSPYKRLDISKNLWLKKWNQTNDRKYLSYVEVIQSIQDKDIGLIRKISCLEWALFSHMTYDREFNFQVPVYLESSWSVWKKDETLKIVYEYGLKTQVTPDLSIINKLFQNGFSLIVDIHNHPALYEHPRFLSKRFRTKLMAKFFRY